MASRTTPLILRPLEANLLAILVGMAVFGQHAGLCSAVLCVVYIAHGLGSRTGTNSARSVASIADRSGRVGMKLITS